MDLSVLALTTMVVVRTTQLIVQRTDSFIGNKVDEALNGGSYQCEEESIIIKEEDIEVS